MKFGFVTCVQLGFSCIKEIYETDGKLELIITLKDEIAQNKSGRVYLDSFCNKKSIELLKINNINDEIVIKTIKKYNIDWLFIIGWSQIAKSDLLNAPLKGTIGMHPTLLPEGRGRASIPWAILKNLERTGVTLFKLDEGIDTGPIIFQEPVLIDNKETAESLYKKVINAHISLITKVWPLLINDSINIIVQDNSKATIWPERKPSDGEILSSMSIYYVEKLVRAVTHPYPGAFWKDGDKTIKIWKGKIRNENDTINKNNYSITLIDGIYEAIEYEIH